jgi:hypothetical protein
VMFGTQRNEISGLPMASQQYRLTCSFASHITTCLESSLTVRHVLGTVQSKRRVPGTVQDMAATVRSCVKIRVPFDRVVQTRSFNTMSTDCSHVHVTISCPYSAGWSRQLYKRYLRRLKETRATCLSFYLRSFCCSFIL